MAKSQDDRTAPLVVFGGSARAADVLVWIIVVVNYQQEHPRASAPARTFGPLRRVASLLAVVVFVALSCGDSGSDTTEAVDNAGERAPTTFDSAAESTVDAAEDVSPVSEDDASTSEQIETSESGVGDVEIDSATAEPASVTDESASTTDATESTESEEAPEASATESAGDVDPAVACNSTEPCAPIKWISINGVHVSDTGCDVSTVATYDEADGNLADAHALIDDIAGTAEKRSQVVALPAECAGTVKYTVDDAPDAPPRWPDSNEVFLEWLPLYYGPESSRIWPQFTPVVKEALHWCYLGVAGSERYLRTGIYHCNTQMSHIGWPSRDLQGSLECLMSEYKDRLREMSQLGHINIFDSWGYAYDSGWHKCPTRFIADPNDQRPFEQRRAELLEGLGAQQELVDEHCFEPYVVYGDDLEGFVSAEMSSCWQAVRLSEAGLAASESQLGDADQLAELGATGRFGCA